MSQKVFCFQEQLACVWNTAPGKHIPRNSLSPLCQSSYMKQIFRQPWAEFNWMKWSFPMLSLPLTWKKQTLEPPTQEMATRGQGACSMPDVALLFSSCPNSEKIIMGKGKGPSLMEEAGGIIWHGAALPSQWMPATESGASWLGTELKGYVVLWSFPYPP